MKIIQNTKFFIKNNLRFKFYLIILLTFFSTLFELIGIASIPFLLTLFMEENVYLIKIFPFLRLLDPFVIIILIGIFFLIKNIYLTLIIYLENKFTKDLSIYFTKILFNRYINFDYLNFTKIEPSVLTRNLIDDTNNLALYFGHLLVSIREILVVIFVFIFLLFSYPTISLIILLSFSILAILYLKVINNYIYNLGKKIFDIRKKQFKFILEFHDFFDILKLFSLKKIYSQEFLSYVNEREQKNLIAKIISKLPKILIEIFGIILLLMLISYLLFKGKSIDESIILLSITAVVIVRFIPAFNSISTSVSNMKKLQNSNERIYDLLNEKVLEKNHINGKNIYISKKLENEEGLIISNLSFGYKKEENIFSDVNLKIEENKSIAFIGDSGSGKSTLIKIILGLIAPKNGLVYFSGKNINSNLNWWFEKCSYIPQKTILFNGDIRQNISLSKNSNIVNDDEIYEALNYAELTDFVNSFPKKIDQEIYYHAKNLSGGQAQRISIARALYRKSEVLVMDEPTSSLDDATRSKLINKIINLKDKKIKILCSHNKEDVNKCDEIYEIKNKQVIKVK